MKATPQRGSLHRFVLVRVARARPRLLLSTAAGLVAVAALPAEWRTSTRLLVGWDVGVTLYLLAVYELIGRSDLARMRQRAAQQDEGALTILVLTVGAALAAFCGGVTPQKAS